MVLALALPGAIVTLAVAALCVHLRVSRRSWPATVLNAPSPEPVSEDSTPVAPGTGPQTSAPAAGQHEPLGHELCPLTGDRELPIRRPFRAQVLWVKRYSSHVLLDLYVLNAAPVCPAASLLCMLPASPWSSWQIHWFLHHCAVASRVVQVEITAGTDWPLLRLSCDRFEVVLAVDPWPAVHA